jgi:hypothetical protein
MLQILFILFIGPLFADLQIGEFKTSNGLTAEFKQAKSMSFKTDDGIILKGGMFGPGTPQSPPTILVPGYASSAAYYGATSTIIAANGVTAYAYSLAGQGQGELRSAYSRQRQDYPGQFSIDRHMNDLMDLIDAVYERHRQAVVLAGHSMGGLIVRGANTGIDLSTDNHRINPRLRARLKKQVKEGKVFNSPSPVISKLSDFDLKLTFGEKWQITKGQFIILHMIPLITRLGDNVIVRGLQSAAASLPLVDLITSVGLRASDFILSDVVASADFRGSRVYESLRTASTQRLERDTVEDLKRYIHQGFLTRQGFDLAEAYLDADTVDKRFPLEIISGEKDILGLKRFNEREAKHLGYRHRINGMTHMSGFFGVSAITTAEIILNAVDSEREWDFEGYCRYMF